MLTKKIQIVAVLTGLLLAAPAISLAQGPGGGGRGGRGGFGGFGGGFGRGGGGTAFLLMMEEVQKEIKVTDAQKAELEKIGESLRPPMGGGGFDPTAFQSLSEEERNKQMEELRKAAEERTKKADDAIKALLQPEQWTRLGELRLQREGVNALTREDFQKQLSLSDEQTAKIKELTEANRQGGFGAGGGRNFQEMSEEERQKMMDEFRKRREDYEKGLASVLTADQTAAWEKLKGAKFEFPQRGFGGGGGGGRRRPPQ